MNIKKEKSFMLPKRVTRLANIIFILSMIGIAVFSFINPHFGLTRGWIVVVLIPIWAFIMGNITAG